MSSVTPPPNSNESEPQSEKGAPKAEMPGMDSGAPIADMIRLIGDKMLGGTGLALLLVMAFTVVLALIGTTLACLNTGVKFRGFQRSSFRQREKHSVGSP